LIKAADGDEVALWGKRNGTDFVRLFRKCDVFVSLGFVPQVAPLKPAQIRLARGRLMLLQQLNGASVIAIL
jgi:hypothetical protein